MNAVARFLRRLAPAAALAGLVAPLCACVDLPKDETPQAQLARATTATNTAIDPNSAAAAEVNRLAAEPVAYPSFRDIPAIPSDVRPPVEWRRSVLALQSAGAQLTRETAPDTFTLNNTDAFAEATRARLDPKASAAPTAAEIADSAAFVKAARARATPPPRPH